MTYRKPDPRYDYSKLTAFIDGVNSVGSRIATLPPREVGQIYVWKPRSLGPTKFFASHIIWKDK